MSSCAIHVCIRQYLHCTSLQWNLPDKRMCSCHHRGNLIYRLHFLYTEMSCTDSVMERTIIIKSSCKICHAICRGVDARNVVFLSLNLRSPIFSKRRPRSKVPSHGLCVSMIKKEYACDVIYINLVPRASPAERPWEQGFNFRHLPWWNNKPGQLRRLNFPVHLHRWACISIVHYQVGDWHWLTGICRPWSNEPGTFFLGPRIVFWLRDL